MSADNTVLKCVGFGEYTGKCTNKAGTKWSPFWCDRCEKLRQDHISEQLNRMSKYGFDR